MTRRYGWLVMLVLALSSLGLAETLTVMTHSSFNISKAVLEAFTEESGIDVKLLEAGDAGEVVNRAILTKRAPIADVLYGVDNNLIATALKADIFEPYESPALALVPEVYGLDADYHVTPIDVGFVNFNLDNAYFTEHDTPLPEDMSMLTDEVYQGLTVVENPTSSSPGLAFMLATIARFGDDWLHYWAALRDNDLLVVEGWTEAYYTAFSRYGGDRPIVLSYATSPAAEVIFSEEPLDEAPTSNLFCSQCAYRQIEGVGILKGTKNRAAAEAFTDFMLSQTFQDDIALNMFVYPVREGAFVPEEFERYSQMPNAEQTAVVDYALLEEEMLEWLEHWTRVVMHGEAP